MFIFVQKKAQSKMAKRRHIKCDIGLLWEITSNSQFKSFAQSFLLHSFLWHSLKYTTLKDCLLMRWSKRTICVCVCVRTRGIRKSTLKMLLMAMTSMQCLKLGENCVWERANKRMNVPWWSNVLIIIIMTIIAFSHSFSALFDVAFSRSLFLF